LKLVNLVDSAIANPLAIESNVANRKTVFVSRLALVSLPALSMMPASESSGPCGGGFFKFGEKSALVFLTRFDAHISLTYAHSSEVS